MHKLVSVLVFIRDNEFKGKQIKIHKKEATSGRRKNKRKTQIIKIRVIK